MLVPSRIRSVLAASAPMSEMASRVSRVSDTHSDP